MDGARSGVGDLGSDSCSGSSNLKGLIAGWTMSMSSLEDDGGGVVRVDQAAAGD